MSNVFHFPQYYIQQDSAYFSIPHKQQRFSLNLTFVFLGLVANTVHSIY